MSAESENTLKRRTAKRRVALVIEILRSDTSVAEAARTQGLTVALALHYSARSPQNMAAFRSVTSRWAYSKRCLIGMLCAPLSR